jgi:hypothetical protein
VPGGPAGHAVFVPQFGLLPAWLPLIEIIAPLDFLWRTVNLFRTAHILYSVASFSNKEMVYAKARDDDNKTKS